MNRAPYLLIPLFLVALPTLAAGQDPAEEAMAAYIAAAQPGAEHEWLANMAGEFEVTVTSWMDPAAEPSVNTASASSEMSLGGRYLVDRYEGSFEGITFEGHGVTGYDNALDRYVGTWIDNMGTGIMVSEGELDDEGRLVMTGSYTDPVSGEEATVKSVTRLTEDGYVTEMYNLLPDGSSFKSMEITARKKI